ncbi:hypothetical protein Hanom_Chr17g01587951 [Helianthus anomalus]
MSLKTTSFNSRISGRVRIKIRIRIRINTCTAFTVESFELSKKAVMFPILSSSFAFFSLLVIFVQVFKLFPAFFPTSLIPMFFRHDPENTRKNEYVQNI